MTRVDGLTASSARVRHARRLTARRRRAEAGEFLAEGPQAVREALRLPAAVVEVFATEAATKGHPDLVGTAGEREVAWHVVDAEVVEEICDTVHPQGVVARCRALHRALADLLIPAPRLLVVCADIRDPGNAGTVVRVADAVGAGGVVFAGHSVDPYNPKAVRASAGSLFHVPVAVEPDTATVIGTLREAGLRVLAADGTATLDLVAADSDGVLAGPTAWLLGNEAWGIPQDLLDLADDAVAVPIYGAAESLNLGTAAAVCLYASATAQRR